MQQFLIDICSREQFNSDNSTPQVVPFFILSKLLYIVGHIAIKVMVHLDTSVYKELKRRDTIRKLRKEKDSDKKDKHSRKSRKSASSVSSTPNSARQQLRNKEVCHLYSTDYCLRSRHN